VGRHIAPAILTRLPVIRDKTRQHGRGQRIVEGHILVNGHELVVLAAHWTSRLRPGSEEGRAKYADSLYGAYRAMHTSNAAVDVLICGDFNDTPQDQSVTRHLKATGDLAAAQQNPSPPILYNLMADKDASGGFGTHYQSSWSIFDQVVVSPGMLDKAGWSCTPASVQTVNTLTKPGDRLSRPWRFGGEKDQGPRGYSDHFPVTVRLHVQP
jgi:endonuclease/exonuclease/phosphatase family metal-dependent hydrolase